MKRERLATRDSGEVLRAYVQYQHGRGCTRGQPYGECGDCRWYPVEWIPSEPSPPKAPHFPEYETAEQALDAGVRGWNLRCNICGNWGASWRGDHIRSAWGALALCKKHDYEFEVEVRRHREVMAVFELIAYEQDAARANEAFAAKYNHLRESESPPAFEDLGD